MAGGTFKAYDKTRPGIYINTVGSEKANVPVSERGILALPLKLDFGDLVNIVTYQSDFKKLYGHEIYDPEMLPIYNALKNAQKVIVYRLNTSGEKASKTDENITITAKHPGALGNEIKVVITEKTDSKYIIETYLKNELVDSQEIATKEEITNNDFVTFNITNLVETAGISLENGTDGEVITKNYTDFLTYIETQKYNTIAFNITDEECATLVPLIKTFIERQREDLGIKVQAIVPVSETKTDYEGIIQVENGVKLSDGTIIDKANITSWIGGLTAGAGVAKSNTYVQYDGAVEGYPAKTHEEIIESIKKGNIVFNEDCKIETDINSLITITPPKISAMSKNRVIRVLDTTCMDLKDLFHNKYIGKINNDDDGRNLWKADVISYLNNLQSQGAITNFDSENDVIVEKGNGTDEVITTIYIEPVDAMEKMYVTINLVIR